MNIERNLENCQQLWNKFSPRKVLWDEWDVNVCFYDPNIYQLMFMYTDKSLLPLVYNSKDNRHEFFGNGFVENRTFWIDDSEVELFFDELPENTYLFDMNGAAVESLLQEHAIVGFAQDEHRNYLKKTTEDWLNDFSGKNRRCLLHDLRKLDYLKCTIEENGFDECIKFNVVRFGADSDFNDPDYLAAQKKLCLLPVIKYLVARIEGIVAVAVIAIHNNILYVLHFGYDASLGISNLGKFLAWKCILLKESMQLDEVDFMAGTNDWKSRFHLEQDKYYSFKK
jgi:hypothetical protein